MSAEMYRQVQLRQAADGLASVAAGQDHVSARLQSRSTRPRIGFFTSIVSRGGSEVAVADAMEGAARLGAELLCWCHRSAAIRKIVAGRPDLLVKFLDWSCSSEPVIDVPGQEAAPRQAIASEQPNAARDLVRAVWRSVVPAPVRLAAGFRRDAQRFQGELRRESPDALFVNVNGSEAAAVGAGWWAREKTINCYHLSHTPAKGPADWLIRRQTIHAAERTIHVSRAVRDQWGDAFGYPADKTCIIYNGVDVRGYVDRRAKRQELGLSEDTVAFCVPGRLHLIKGHRYLLEALATQKGFENCRVLFAGEGELRRELESMTRDYALQDRIAFLGYRDDLPDLLHACDCTVMPSIESENLSLAVLESMMAGTPAIVTQVGGMSEAIDDGRTGYVVPPANAGALRTAMLQIADNRQHAIELGQRAAETARRRFLRSRMIDEYTDCFRHVLDKAVARTTLLD